MANLPHFAAETQDTLLDALEDTGVAEILNR